MGKCRMVSPKTSSVERLYRQKAAMSNNIRIDIEGSAIAVIKNNGDDYISLTDLAKHKNTEHTGVVISHWMSTRYAIEFMGIWERVNNPDFNITEFRYIRNESGSNGFVLSTKQWLEKTLAIGIVAKAGRYGGTYAHKDIAFEFATWISPELKFYLIKEFQRLKEQEQKLLGWNLQRTLAKINYRIHTDAIKENLIPPELPKEKINFVYASEADLLNVALFGMTAKEWRDAHPEDKGNIRDLATIEQLVVLSNLESINAMLIHQGQNQSQRITQLNAMAITQMRSLLALDDTRKRLATKHD